MSNLSIKETCIYVNDLEAIRRFYREIMGLEEINFAEGRHVFFRVGTGVLLFFNPEATRNEKILPAHFAHGKQHLAFEVSNEEYLNWKGKLEAADITIIHQQQWKEGVFSFYFEDPAGNVLEILQPHVWD